MNPAAAMHFLGCSIHMAPGWIWKLDPSISHAASNHGAEPRTHLILNCYINETLRSMLSDERLDMQYLEKHPKLETEERRAVF